MRCLAFLLLALSLTACGTAKERPMLDLAKSIAQSAKAKDEPATIAQQRAALIAQLKASGSTQPVILAEVTERGAVASLSIAGKNAGAVSWFDPSGVSLVTQQGVVIETRGLGSDLMSSDMSGTLRALNAGDGSGYNRLHRYLNGEGKALDITFGCDARRNGAQIEESCRASNASFTNTYELRGGQVVRSRQWLGPDIGYVAITRLQ